MQEEICPDLGLIMLATENHTVNHTSNEEWGFPRHVHAGKPHSGKVVGLVVATNMKSGIPETPCSLPGLCSEIVNKGDFLNK